MSAAADSPTDAERIALIERFRQSGLRLDRDGVWWHEGQRVLHQRLASTLHRWLDRLDDGRFIVRLDPQRYAYVDVDDAPYQVRRLRVSGPITRPTVDLCLSDGSSEPLATDTVHFGRDQACYCRVKQRKFVARFSRQAQLTLGELLHEAPDGSIRLGSAGPALDPAGDQSSGSSGRRK